MDIMTLAAKISLDSKGFESGLKDSESKLKSYGDKISAWAVAKGRVIGGLIEKAGQSTITFVKGALSERMEFDKAMAQVAATLGKTTSEVQELSKFARKMGAETAFTANEAAQALNYMALAGYDSATSMKMLPTVLNLAAAGNFDLARASDMVTDAQSALGLSVEETETMVDQMAKTASKTNTSVEQLGDAFLTVGGTAKNLKGGTKELSAVLGVLADNGIKGSEGGTALRNIMLSLTAPTKQAAAELRRMKINVFDKNGNMKEFPEILEDINKATSKMTDKQRTEFLSKVFNKRDLKSIEALLGTSKDRWAELFEEIGNADGAANKMAKTQLDNLKGDVTIFQSALGEAKLSLVAGLTPALRKFTQFGTTSLQRLTKAFNKRGFAGAVQVAGNIFESFISTMRGSGNSAVRTFGLALRRTWDGFKAVRLIFKDFPAGMKKLKGVASAVFGDIKEGIKKGKIKIADMLGIEDSENATWGDIGTQITNNIKAKLKGTKIKIADLLGVEEPEDATWADIGGKITERLKTGVGAAKVKIAELLDVDNPEEATWSDIGDKIKTRLKTGISKAKVKLAELLDIDSPEEATWNDIGDKIKTRLTTGISKAKVKLAGLLDVDDPEEASWADIGTKVKERLTSGVGKAKVKLAELLGLSKESVEGEGGWEEIGKAVVDKLTGHLSHKGDFLKKLILGDEFDPDKSTWLDVGTKIAGWIEESFGEGGFLQTLLTTGLDKLTGLAPVIGQLMSGFADWIKNNSGQIVEIVTSLANAIAQAAGPIIEALATILTDQKLWTGLGDALEAVLISILQSLGIIPKGFQPQAPEPPKKGERKLHGNALTEEQKSSLIMARKLWLNDTEGGLFQLPNGGSTDALGWYKWTFKDLLKRNGFEDSDIDTLWNEAQTQQDSEFAKTLTDLTNASMANVKPMEDLATSTGETSSKMESAGENAGNASDALSSVTDAANSAADALSGITAPGGEKEPGSAKGLWTVPYDNYRTRLHRNEMVLTASQARRYKEGKGGMNVSGMSKAIVAAVKQGMADASVNAYVNGDGMTNMVNSNTANRLKGRRFAPA